MEDRKMNGCLPGKIDVRDYKIKKKVAMALQFPEEFICTNMPPVKDQGSVGSCVAHATSEILEYHDNCEHKLSTNFLYGIHYKLYKSEGPGMYLREACKIANEYGDPEYDYCPGNTEVNEVYSEAEEAFKDIETRNNAHEHRIKGYAKLRTNDEIKYALLNYGPVLSAVVWYEENKVQDGVLIKGDTKSGGHAIMIYGWNKQGFICQNSWGKTWGKKGSFILPYEYKVDEAYSIIPLSGDKQKDDLVKPSTNEVLDALFKIINFIINLFRFK